MFWQYIKKYQRSISSEPPTSAVACILQFTNSHVTHKMFGKSIRQLLFILLALSYPSFILASPAPSSAQFPKMIMHGSRDAVPQGFAIQGPTSPEKSLISGSQ